MSKPTVNPLRDDLDHILAHTQGRWDDLRGRHLFITGGTGFFGCWLLESFIWANDTLGLNAEAVVLTRDPDAFRRKAPHLAGHPAIRLHPGDVRNFTFPEGRFSHVIHAATDASAKLNAERPLLMLDTIVEGTRHTLDFAVQAGAKTFLLASSGAVYGKQPAEMTHLPEDYLGAPDPHDPGAAYGEGKRLAELLCTLYHRRHGIETKIARCFAFVGPYLPQDTHFAMGNFIRDALTGGPIVVNGDGTPYRSYLYAADLAIWLWTILFRAPACRPYNVGSGEAVTILETARFVAESATPVLPVTVALAPADAPPQRYVPDVSRAATELGLKAWIGPAEAIQKTLDFHHSGLRERATAGRFNLKPATRPCPVCGTETCERLHTQKFVLVEGHPLADGYEVVCCGRCGFAYADTAARQADYDRFYAGVSKYADLTTSTGGGETAGDAARLAETAAAISGVEANRNAAIADIGCATGGLLRALSALGYRHLCGIDPSPECAAGCARINGTVGHAGSLSALPPGVGPFDLIILCHVLEHVRDLGGALAGVRGLLKPGGRLYVETPDASRYAERVEAPFQEFNTEHINHFSLQGMHNLLGICGFTPETSGSKDLPTASGAPYPALFVFARRTAGGAPAPVLTRDRELRETLARYVADSARMMRRLDHQISRVLAKSPEVVVWGTGQLAMKLLAETCLARARIAAFVDGNPVNHGRHLAGTRIVAPADVPRGKTPILVTSTLHHDAIAAHIRSLKLPNPIVRLVCHE